MKTRILIVLVLMLAMSYSVFAAQQNVHLNLINAKTGGPISDILVSIDINGAFFTNSYIEKNSTVELALPNDAYLIELRVEDLNTPGKDYYAKETLNINGSRTKEMVIFPVGTIDGVVIDDKGNPVAGADLSFECSDNVRSFPEKTDDFGFFTAVYVSEGKCRVFASKLNNTGRADVSVKKGSLNEIKIKLTKEKTNSYYLLAFALIILVVIVFLIRKKIIGKDTKAKPKKSKLKSKVNSSKKAETDEESNKVEQGTGERVQDIIKTLDAKEKAVVDFLLNNSHKSNQAAIRHTTGLPRTTLTRLLSRLESRKIIEIEKQGKAVRVSLTNWVLGKE